MLNELLDCPLDAAVCDDEWIDAVVVRVDETPEWVSGMLSACCWVVRLLVLVVVRVVGACCDGLKEAVCCRLVLLFPKVLWWVVLLAK